MERGRRSAAEAARTRASIVDAAVAVGSAQGMEGVSIGRLAAEVGMSKAGILNHFGSKQGLQLAAVEAAVATFVREVWDPAAGAEPGLDRLRAIGEAWVAYTERAPFPGGCFLTAAACEFDDRPGPVRDAVAEALARWQRVLEREARTAVEAGELPPGTDPRLVAFELAATAQGLNQALRLRRDAGAPALARLSIGRVLGRGSRAGEAGG